MGTQRPVIIGEEISEDLGGPIAEHHGKKKLKVKSAFRHSKLKVEEKIKEGKFKKEEITEVSKPVDLPAQKSAKAGAEGEAREAPKKKVKVGKAKVRSKKYQAVNALIDHAQKYNLVEALDLVKKTSLTKFDGNVEVHIRILGKSGKPENIRGMLKYPHATGKSIKVVILDEKIAAEIEKTGKADADIYVTTPEMMSKIAKLAKILGPKSKMPNPKSGTISDNPEKTKKELEGGQVEYKSDSYGNIHQIIGKVSSASKMLEENFNALLYVLPKEKITSITICATMGPGIKVQV